MCVMYVMYVVYVVYVTYVWYGMVWYGMVCYVMLCYLCYVVLCYVICTYVRTCIRKLVGILHIQVGDALITTLVPSCFVNKKSKSGKSC